MISDIPATRRTELASFLRTQRGRLTPADVGLIWMMFTDRQNRARMVNWEPAALAVLGQFRIAVGRHPGDVRFGELVADLNRASPEFRKWWAEYPVRSFRPATIAIDHPSAGRIRLQMFQLRPVDQPDLVMVIQVPASPADRARVMSLLTQERKGSNGN